MTETKKENNENKKSEIMQKHLQMVKFIQNTINNIETDLKRANIILNQLSKFDPENPETINEIENKEIFWESTLKNYNEENVEIIEGKFDWYFMTWSDQKKYPVPVNYSSKTKLVPWDILKLKILEDWKFIYKLIQPTDRKHIRARLSKTDDNKFIAITEEWKSYFLNQAAVTFFKWKPWDELYILINEKEDMWFAAIEAIIKS